MPPITVATGSPTAKVPPGAAATVPVASMPRMRGKLTPGEWPCRVKSSERFSPKASTRISTSPGCGCGIGRRSMRSTSGPPGACITAARMVSVMAGSPSFGAAKARAM